MVDTQRSNCPITFALDLFGDKWSLLILRDIILQNKRYYHEFSEAEEGISTNILANRLSKLEANGLITKKRDPENNRKYIYSPSPKSLDLLPMLVEMILWSAKYDPNTGVKPGNNQAIAQDKHAYITQILSKFAEGRH